MASQGNTMFVGIDFGTTFSGVAIVFGGTPKDIEVIRTWPGVSTSSDKCPTLILYPDDASMLHLNGSSSDWVLGLLDSAGSFLARTQFGPRKGIRWGHEIRVPKEQPIRCIKLFLDRGQKLPTWIDDLETLAALQRNDRLPKDAVADYLSKVHEHVKGHMARRYAASFLTGIKLQFVLTVPAVWSDNAKDATMAAAKHAGIGPNIMMISEPEAAAYFVLRSENAPLFKCDDHIVVCDAGGGTVDLISYCITSTAPQALKECAVGTGDVCGAMNINMRFEEHLRQRLGHANFDRFKKEKAKTWQMAMKYFDEEPKRLISCASDEDFEVPWPGVVDDDAIGISDGFLTLSSSQVRAIFDPVIDDVIRLIDGQVSNIREDGKAVNAILLVGGFGQSQYLFEKVQSRFAASSSHLQKSVKKKRTIDDIGKDCYGSIPVIQPAQGWTAIAQGAALYGLDNGLVTARKSRYNYGTTFQDRFDPARHDSADMYYCMFSGKHRVANAMQWYVHKHEDIHEQRAISMDFSFNWESVKFPSHASLQKSSTVLMNNDDRAPVMKKGGLVTTVCTLHTDLSKVPRNHFKQKTGTNGNNYWFLTFTFEMRIESARLDFRLLVDGKEYGCVESQFE